MVMLGTDMKVAETPKEGLKDFAKTDPYSDWLKAEGVRVHEEFYFPSLAKVELGPWERKGGTTFHFVGGGIEDALRRCRRQLAEQHDIRLHLAAALRAEVPVHPDHLQRRPCLCPRS